ncbi:hypothetical protein CERSUDRAFT_122314 [Gelatoporia subvermispora B]|uniref:BTB domain-containing protein n=1 Tax=Ceriporiopsis subvermispora (strain B) TaxID=914234 RepID=M2QNU5_CERS8|nr:hypothetical protein CERSUDRAFT_122314 [Gelatoporia subvermispora B]
MSAFTSVLSDHANDIESSPSPLAPTPNLPAVDELVELLQTASAAADDPPTRPEPKRHRDLWFSDGSIILRAEHTLFRVHMSQLSRKSIFFRNMFDMPLPSPELRESVDDIDPIIDGCPVLTLQDSAEDWENLLHALYDGPWFGNNDRDDFRAISGILRLATKYIVDSLRKRALAHLCIAWPSALKEWDAREDIARIYELENATHRGLRYPSPVAIIHLARENDTSELLPAAFYDLARYQVSQMYEPGEGEPLAQPPLADSLGADDARRLALGKEALQHAVPALIQSMGAAPHRDAAHPAHVHHRRKSAGAVCTSAAACRKDFTELVELATQHYLFDRGPGCCDPLYVAEELGQLKSAEFSECKACARALEAWAARERERIWKAIPGWFRLKP